MRKIFISIFAFAIFIFAPQANAEEVIPGIISVSESSGSTDGGNTVTLTGANFTESTVFKVGNNEAEVNYIDSSTVEITVPPGDEGDATISASNGMVAAIAEDRYLYVAPEPVPDPISDPAPAPAPAPAPDPISDPAPAPAPAPAPEPQNLSSPVSEPVVEEVVQEDFIESTEIIPEVTYLSDNAYLLYEDDIENLVVKTEYNVPQKFVLRQRVDGGWSYIDKSYQFDGNLAFLNIDLQLGETYKVIVEIDGKKTIASWFTVLEKKYEVS